MRYIVLVLLAILSLAVLLLIIGLYSSWQIYLHITNKKIVAELRSFKLRKTLFNISLSESKQKSESAKDAPVSGQTASESKNKGSKLNRFTGRLKADKKRIYDSEKGGFQESEFKAVIDEYIGIFRQIKNSLYDFLGDLRCKIEIPMFRIRLDIGLDNPAYTGMIYSTIWGAVGIIYPIMSRFFHVVYPTMNITPYFYERRFDLDIESIIKVKPAHIINALVKQGVRAAITYFKKIFTKGSVKHV